MVQESHKFQNKVSLTFEQHFRMMFANVVSLLRDLEDEVGTECILNVITKSSKRRGAEMAGEKRVASFEEFKEYWKAASKDHFFANSVTVEFPSETDTELQCNYTECLFAKTFKDLGAAELGKIMACDPDYTFAQALSPHLHLERTKTLMEGHDCCDHKYIWKE